MRVDVMTLKMEDGSTEEFFDQLKLMSLLTTSAEQLLRSTKMIHKKLIDCAYAQYLLKYAENIGPEHVPLNNNPVEIMELDGKLQTIEITDNFGKKFLVYFTTHKCANYISLKSLKKLASASMMAKGEVLLNSKADMEAFLLFQKKIDNLNSKPSLLLTQNHQRSVKGLPFND